MTVKYTIKTSLNNEQYVERINQDNSISFIPMNEENADYCEYLKSLDEAASL